MKKRPLIGITRAQSRDRFACWMIRWGLKIAGARVVLITPKKPRTQQKLDGIVFSGGVDIHPDRYHYPIKEKYPYDHQRDALEWTWIKRAEQAGLPILGICRGAQLINIYRGGNLHPDVSKAYEKAQYPTSLLARIFYRKRMYVRSSTKIHHIVGDDKIKVNSIHTQSINRLGRDLVITAKEHNGVVQVIEDPNYPFLIGLQFHPEFLIYSKYHRNIFKAFVDACKKFKMHS